MPLPIPVALATVIIVGTLVNVIVPDTVEEFSKDKVATKPLIAVIVAPTPIPVPETPIPITRFVAEESVIVEVNLDPVAVTPVGAVKTKVPVVETFALPAARTGVKIN
jgi:hypothetical protein